MRRLAVLIAFTVVLGHGAFVPAVGGAFWGGVVIGALPADPLNVRECASTKCPVQRTYTSGDEVSMTGACLNTATRRRMTVRATAAFNRSLQGANVWCSIWHAVPDEDGEYMVGWARGKYLRVVG
jgi:hypothetical protein